jgi:hypothetical protein
MRFLKIVPVIAIAAAVAVAACEQEGAVEEGTELTPADTAMTTPPPAPDMDTIDTMIMEGDTMMMMEGDTTVM